MAKLTINLKALQYNYKKLSAMAAPMLCGASVKANAYGLGLAPVVKALAEVGCETFFVAHLEEALALRAELPEAMIYALNGLPPQSAQAFIEARIRPVIGSFPEWQEWHEAAKTMPLAAKTMPLAAKQTPPPYALHFDTGLNRLGFPIKAAPALAADIASHKVYPPALVMSHFASSENHYAPLNAQQIWRFNELIKHFPDVPRSLSNSSGMFLPALAPKSSEARQIPTYQLARLGYALFGGNPTPEHENPMREVVRIEAPVIQVKIAEPGEGVGYNSRWRAKRETRIALLSIGYGDGLPRALSGRDEKQGGSVAFKGIECPIIGSISMDIMAVDITDLKEGSVKRGDMALIIGDALSLDHVAAQAGTIGYELLTSLGTRYQRVYICAK